MIKISGIAIRQRSRAPMQTISDALVSTESGVAGDFRGKPGKRQVTLLSENIWQQVCEQMQQSMPWTTRRANLLISGYQFSAADVGKQVKIGELILQICKETEPCPRMDEQYQGLTAKLAPDWRGGVCCRVIQSGHIEVGDRVIINHAAE
ncbi:MOSC domain-containing protein [Neptunicella sp. SCSIO 80796]|uniref:MOSC domain-containing protein n=1 Tax=Neptunicella plasticusilytica TaxID=3117012 RepID=UPI003A4E52A2